MCGWVTGHRSNSCNFSSACSVAGSGLSSFHLTCLILFNTSVGRYYYYRHVTDGETEAREGKL